MVITIVNIIKCVICFSPNHTSGDFECNISLGLLIYVYPYIPKKCPDIHMAYQDTSLVNQDTLEKQLFTFANDTLWGSYYTSWRIRGRSKICWKFLPYI